MTAAETRTVCWIGYAHERDLSANAGSLAVETRQAALGMVWKYSVSRTWGEGEERDLDSPLLDEDRAWIAA